jgi:A/G-specific adenine glycosylase
MTPAALRSAVERELPLDFAPRLIAWQRQHGRHGLPWQHTGDPYRVWLSEVMLQQTQVSTVLGYYPRFLAAFPTLQALAQASSDEVMALWAGLGYYSRARNLHRCAQVVVAEHGGAFPAHSQQLQTLPGIGASTAAAIAAFCHGERVSIVDGNVRRVLSRLLAFDQDLAQAASQSVLWDLAQGLLPGSPSPDDMVAYTQGLMDLGATVCLRSKPQCARCPVNSLCAARAADAVGRYPVKSKAVKRRHESWWLLVLRLRPAAACDSADSAERFWLQRRPVPGIWAGLFCPPVFASEELLMAACATGSAEDIQYLDPVAHSLTHRELRLHPVVVTTTADQPFGLDGSWVSASDLADRGLPTPVRALYQRLPA